MWEHNYIRKCRFYNQGEIAFMENTAWHYFRTKLGQVPKQNPNLVILN